MTNYIKSFQFIIWTGDYFWLFNSTGNVWNFSKDGFASLQFADGKPTIAKKSAEILGKSEPGDKSEEAKKAAEAAAATQTLTEESEASSSESEVAAEAAAESAASW